MLPAEDMCLHDLVAAQAVRTPDAVAVVADDGTLTYAELLGRANRLAHRLRGRGVGADTLVGVAVERSADLVVALLGVLVAGGAYVPVELDHPPERLGYLLADADPAVLLVQREATGLIADPAVRERLCMIGAGEAHGDTATPAPEPLATPDSLAYVIYTSGSTGRPKGVCVPHRGIVNRIRWMQQEYRLRADDVVLQKTPYGFDVSVWEFFWPLATGARLVLARPGGHRDPAYLAGTVVEHGVTTIHFVPTMLVQFLADPELPELPSLRRVICSGEALPVTTAREAARRFPGELHNLYGPTEASVDVSAYRVPPDSDAATVPIGRPIANIALHVLDERLDPVPAGTVGELYIGGVGLARGYHRRPALTAERFLPDPTGTGRLYRTGDLVRELPDGNLDFVGRADNQVKIHGNRVELGEIEQTLLRHDGVRAAAVTVRELSSGHSRLVAYVAPSSVTAPELRAHASRHLPHYMVPAAFVLLDRLPVTASGKTDRGALPPPDPAADAGPVAGDAPVSAVELRLAAVWAQVLEIDRVGVHDSFFGLGGDSVLAMRAVVLGRQAGLRLTTRQLFEHPSVAALAPHAAVCDPVDDRGADLDGVPFDLCPVGPAALGPAVEDAYPLTPMQEGMLFHSLLAPGESDYLQQHVYRLDRPVDVESLASAWRAAVRRHPALRTTVRWEDVAEPVQAVHAGHSPEVRILDWRAGGDLSGYLAAERAAGFDLASAPPLRVTLIRRASGRTDLVLTFHHILLDGWSLAVLLAEVLGDRREPVVPFRRYLRWLAGADRATGYWRRLLADLPEPAVLPRATGTNTRGGGTAQVRLPLGDRLWSAVTRRAAAVGVTPYAVTLASWMITLGSCAARSDIVVGVTVAGRPDGLPGVESIVGMLVNTIPVRVRLTPAATFAGMLRDVQAQQAASRDHEHHSLADILRAVGLRSGTPLFDSIVVYQNHPPLPAGLSEVCVVESTGYPLTLLVELTPTPTLRLLIRRDAVDPADGDRMLAGMRRTLRFVEAHPEATIAAVTAAVTAG